MFRKVRLFKTISKKESKKVDICYRDYPDEENYASETIVELDYNDVLIMIQRHLAKDEEDNDIFELIENEVELAAIEEAYNTIFMDEE